MNRTEIAALAREAGLAQVKTGHGLAGFVFHFAALVAAAEREKCALTAWEIVQYEVHADLADQVAQAIRARSPASTARMCPSTYYECQRGCGKGGCKDFEDTHQASKA